MSCENNLKEFDHPEYGILDPSQVRELRDELTRCLIDYIGGLSNHLREREAGDIEKDRVTKFHYLRVCATIQNLNKIDPGWCLRYFAPDDECLKIKLHDCKCCYHTCQELNKVIQSPKSNSNKISQTKDKELAQE
jgi:hypothetical protein